MVKCLLARTALKESIRKGCGRGRNLLSKRNFLFTHSLPRKPTNYIQPCNTGILYLSFNQSYLKISLTVFNGDYTQGRAYRTEKKEGRAPTVVSGVQRGSETPVQVWDSDPFRTKL